MDIFGESKTIEYKELIPSKSIKYMKTVVAFSNCNGGKIIFGIHDQTHEIIGFDKEDIFTKIDAITNAISDSCYPTIVPDVTPLTIEGKTVIVVEIKSGQQKPYYIKSEGIQNGVYIRVGATTRLADDFMIKELMFEGENRYFDQSICYNMKITDKDIDDLCQSLKQSALQNCVTDDEKNNVKDVTKNQLIQWGVLVEKDGELLPTYAFALLSGDYHFSTKIQCAVFRGNDRVIFLDRREFDGPIQHQVDEAYNYILLKINLGAKIEGLYRQDVYELPEASIREIIVNSVVHRSYLDPGNIQIALYDNRLEITSPGMLAQGVTIEKMKEGYSKVRNRAIANAFVYMKYIEEWGSGIPRIFREFEERGLKEPEIIDYDGDLRINLYRPNYNVLETKGDQEETKRDQRETKKNYIFNKFESDLDEIDRMIIDLIIENPKITQRDLSLKLGLTKTPVQKRQKHLIELGIIKRTGGRRYGYWEIIENNKEN